MIRNPPVPQKSAVARRQAAAGDDGAAAASAPDFISTQVTDAQRFYHAIERKPASPVAVVCGGWEECAPDYHIDRKLFPYYSLEFVAGGEGQVELNGDPHRLAAGSVFTYGPRVAQRIRTSPERRLLKYFVDFTGPGARALLVNAGLPPGSARQLTATAEVRTAFDALIRFASARHPGATRMCCLQLEILLLAIQHATEPGSPSERRARVTFERSRRNIDSGFLSLRTVEQVAALCHIDASYLSRLFQRFQGVTPLRYIQTLQMQWAAERLHSSGHLVRQIADELGVDAFQFSRTFKRIHGLSPSAFLDSRR